MNENPVESEVDSAPALPATPAPVSFDPRRRIRELLAIPDRDRTDAEWDELNELEIQTAPGNRAAGGQALAYPSNNKPAARLAIRVRCCLSIDMLVFGAKQQRHLAAHRFGLI